MTRATGSHGPRSSDWLTLQKTLIRLAFLRESGVCYSVMLLLRVCAVSRLHSDIIVDGQTSFRSCRQ